MNFTVYIVHFKLYNLQCEVHIVDFTLLNCKVYFITECKVSNVKCTVQCENILTGLILHITKITYYELIYVLQNKYWWYFSGYNMGIVL